jgi:predicted phosphodiesterase
MIDKNQALEKFASIIKEQGTISAVVYDTLKTEKPSRRVLYRLFGKWGDALEEAKKYLAEMGDEIPVVEKEETGPKTSDAEEQVKKLQRQVQELTRHIQSPKLCLDGTHHKFGYVSDTHLGSLYSDKALLNYAYDVFELENIKTVFHSGDIAEGQKMFKGQEYEIEAIGSDAQVNLITEVYPKRNGITTYFIVGNHDRSFWKDGGNDIGVKISDKRSDLVCLGHQEADITIGDDDCTATIRLCHPDGGTAYAISYNAQKYIEALPSGTKPDVMCLGHYHKAEVLFYRGVCVIQGGTTQMQTPFMRGRKLSAAMGFWIFEISIAPNRVVSLTTTFYPVRT